MAPHCADTRATLLLTSTNYKKAEARGQKDTGFPYKVKQSIWNSVVSADDDLAKMCLTDEHRSVREKEALKKLDKLKECLRQPGTEA